MKRLFNKIKGKGGASLLIVLASILFLTIIATTTLTSSLGAVSVVQHQKEKAQIDLFAESVQMSLFDMLNDNDPAGLQSTLLLSIYEARTAGGATATTFDTLTLSIEEDDESGNLVATHNFICDLDTSALSIFGTNNFSGVVTFDVKIDLNLDDDPTIADPAAEATYRMVYSLVTNAVIDTTAGADPVIGTFGEWNLVTYEKIDS